MSNNNVAYELKLLLNTFKECLVAFESDFKKSCKPDNVPETVASRLFPMLIKLFEIAKKIQSLAKNQAGSLECYSCLPKAKNRSVDEQL